MGRRPRGAGRPPWWEPFQRAFRHGSYIASHTAVAAILILAVAVTQWLVKLAGEPKLFGSFPLGYVFDIMEIAIFVAYLVFGTLEAIRVFRED
jgi:hypothetical protein